MTQKNNPCRRSLIILIISLLITNIATIILAFALCANAYHPMMQCVIERDNLRFDLQHVQYENNALLNTILICSKKLNDSTSPIKINEGDEYE